MVPLHSYWQFPSTAKQLEAIRHSSSLKKHKDPTFKTKRTVERHSGNKDKRERTRRWIGTQADAHSRHTQKVESVANPKQESARFETLLDASPSPSHYDSEAPAVDRLPRGGKGTVAKPTKRSTRRDSVNSLERKLKQKLPLSVGSGRGPSICLYSDKSALFGSYLSTRASGGAAKPSDRHGGRPQEPPLPPQPPLDSDVHWLSVASEASIEASPLEPPVPIALLNRGGTVSKKTRGGVSTAMVPLPIPKEATGERGMCFAASSVADAAVKDGQRRCEASLDDSTATLGRHKERDVCPTVLEEREGVRVKPHRAWGVPQERWRRDKETEGRFQDTHRDLPALSEATRRRYVRRYRSPLVQDVDKGLEVPLPRGSRGILREQGRRLEAKYPQRTAGVHVPPPANRSGVEGTRGPVSLVEASMASVGVFRSPHGSLDVAEWVGVHPSATAASNRMLDVGAQGQAKDVLWDPSVFPKPPLRSVGVARRLSPKRRAVSWALPQSWLLPKTERPRPPEPIVPHETEVVKAMSYTGVLPQQLALWTVPYGVYSGLESSTQTVGLTVSAAAEKQRDRDGPLGAPRNGLGSPVVASCRTVVGAPISGERSAVLSNEGTLQTQRAVGISIGNASVLRQMHSTHCTYSSDALVTPLNKRLYRISGDTFTAERGVSPFGYGEWEDEEIGGTDAERFGLERGDATAVLSGDRLKSVPFHVGLDVMRDTKGLKEGDGSMKGSVKLSDKERRTREGLQEAVDMGIGRRLWKSPERPKRISILPIVGSQPSYNASTQHNEEEGVSADRPPPTHWGPPPLFDAAHGTGKRLQKAEPRSGDTREGQRPFLRASRGFTTVAVTKGLLAKYKIPLPPQGFQPSLELKAPTKESTLLLQSLLLLQLSQKYKTFLVSKLLEMPEEGKFNGQRKQMLVKLLTLLFYRVCVMFPKTMVQKQRWRAQSKWKEAAKGVVSSKQSRQLRVEFTTAMAHQFHQHILRTTKLLREWESAKGLLQRLEVTPTALDLQETFSVGESSSRSATTPARTVALEASHGVAVDTRLIGIEERMIHEVVITREFAEAFESQRQQLGVVHKRQMRRLQRFILKGIRNSSMALDGLTSYRSNIEAFSLLLANRVISNVDEKKHLRLMQNTARKPPQEAFVSMDESNNTPLWLKKFAHRLPSFVNKVNLHSNNSMELETYLWSSESGPGNRPSLNSGLDEAVKATRLSQDHSTGDQENEDAAGRNEGSIRNQMKRRLPFVSAEPPCSRPSLSSSSLNIINTDGSKAFGLSLPIASAGVAPCREVPKQTHSSVVSLYASKSSQQWPSKRDAGLWSNRATDAHDVSSSSVQDISDVGFEDFIVPQPTLRKAA